MRSSSVPFGSFRAWMSRRSLSAAKAPAPAAGTARLALPKERLIVSSLAEVGIAADKNDFLLSGIGIGTPAAVFVAAAHARRPEGGGARPEDGWRRRPG